MLGISSDEDRGKGYGGRQEGQGSMKRGKSSFRRKEKKVLGY